MRRPIYFPAVILIILLSSCSTLNVLEIKNLNRAEFEPLQLKPHLESTELRVDLIRQSHEKQVNDSTVEREDTDYHHLGFDLGNGLYYDLNDNLSFRIDDLLGVDDQNCWTMEQTNKRKQKRASNVYTLCNDSLTVRYPPGRTEHLQYRLIREDGTITAKWRNRLLYQVDQDKNSTVYRYKKRKLAEISKEDENHYILKEGRRKENFILQGNRLLLKREYIIEMTSDHEKIRVINPGFLRSRVLFSIEKSDRSIYIYDRNYQGKKIESNGSSLTVYHGKTFLNRWELH